MKTETKFVSTREEIDNLGSAITIEGLTLDDVSKFADWCHEKAKFRVPVPVCHVTTGEVMNSLYGLTGSNAYPDDLNICSFELGDFENSDALTFPRFEIGARWLDDIVDNNAWRERERRGETED